MACFAVATPAFASGFLIGGGRRAAVQSLILVVRATSRPPVRRASSTASAGHPMVFGHGQHSASRFEGRTWGSSPSRAPLRDRPGARLPRCSVAIRFPVQA